MRRRKEKEQGPGSPATVSHSTGEDRSHHRLTPVDIQQKEFRGARWGRGYNEGDVDQFLDEVTEEVARLHAENKRLREDLEFRGTARLQMDPAVEADEMVRRAREEASRIIADAEARTGGVAAEREGWRDLAGTGAGASGTLRPGITEAPEWKASLGRFLSREKEFLQSLAALIQHHAEGVKDDAQQARDDLAKMGSGGEEETPQVFESEPEISVENPEALDPDAAFLPESGPVIDLTGEGAEPVAGGTDRASDEAGSPEDSERSFEPFEPASDDDWSHEDEEAVAAEEWRETASPSMAARSHEATESEAAAEDRSLRELFWGED
jgi:DivIVA domain-containing protein